MIAPTFLLASLWLWSAVARPLATNNTLEARAPSGSKSVIIQMFEWTWDSIAAECTSFIGPAGKVSVNLLLQTQLSLAYTYAPCQGYGYIQASPAQEHVQGMQYFERRFLYESSNSVLPHMQARSGGLITSLSPTF